VKIFIKMIMTRKNLATNIKSLKNSPSNIDL